MQIKTSLRLLGGVLILFLMAIDFLKPLRGQTKVDLSQQSMNVDFTQMLSTKPLATGISIPTSCSTGQMFFKSNGPAGQNVYACGPSGFALVGASGTSGGSGTVVAGPSGALDCSTVPGVCDIVTALVPLKPSANVMTGVNQFSQLQVVLYTVAALPPCNANVEGQMEGVTDASSPSYLATVTGGGTGHIPVYCNGLAWVAH